MIIMEIVIYAMILATIVYILELLILVLLVIVPITDFYKDLSVNVLMVIIKMGPLFVLSVNIVA